MNIQQSFVVQYPIATVWDSLKDVKLVAECMPGATLHEMVTETRYKGRFTVRLGPIVANFEGDVDIDSRDEIHTGVIRAQAVDRRTATRIQTEIRYGATTQDGGTRVEIAGEYSLAGSLAQFARKGLMDEITNRLTVAFADALRERLARSQPADACVPRELEATTRESSLSPKSINAGSLLGSILRAWGTRFWKRIFGLKTHLHKPRQDI